MRRIVSAERNQKHDRSSGGIADSMDTAKELIQKGGVNLFHQLDEPAIELIRLGLSQPGDDIAWPFILLCFGVVEDLPILISAGRIQTSTITPDFLKNLRKATIIEKCLTDRIVKLSTLQAHLTFERNVVTIDELKDLLIECIFDHVLTGKIDDEQNQFFVSWVGREYSLYN